MTEGRDVYNNLMDVGRERARERQRERDRERETERERKGTYLSIHDWDQSTIDCCMCVCLSRAASICNTNTTHITATPANTCQQTLHTLFLARSCQSLAVVYRGISQPPRV